MPKFTAPEREIIKTLVASLSLKRIPDLEILGEIERQTHKPISQRYLTDIKQLIKRENFHWYKTLRESQYDFLHEYKERINEIMDLQRYHQQIINNDREPTPVKQTSLAELHRLSITLSNLYDVAPGIVNGITLPTSPEDKTTEQQSTISEESEIIV